MAIFTVLVAAVLAVMFGLGRRGTTATGVQRGWALPPAGHGAAIAGDFLSAAAVLGVAGAIAVSGSPGLVYPVGLLLGALVALGLLTKALADNGLYTMGEALSFRMRHPAVRTAAAISTLTVCLFCLVAELVGAGALITLLLEVPNGDGGRQATVIAATGAIVIVYVLAGGIRGTAGVQILKTTLLLAAAAAITVGVLSRFGWDPSALVGQASRAGDNPALGVGSVGLGPQSGVDSVGATNIISVGLALVAGVAALPHMLPRLSTVPTGPGLRRSLVWAIWLIGVFLLLILAAGYAAAWVVPAGDGPIAGAAGATNSALGQLAFNLGGQLGLGLICAIAFTAIAATVAALTVTASAAIAHDLHPNARNKAATEPGAAIRVARASAVLLGAAAIAGAIATRDQNVAFLAALGFAIAASANLPTICYSLSWRAFTTTGALWSIYGGLTTTVVLIVFSPVVSGTPDSMIPTANFAVVALDNPALVSLPVSFVLGYLGTVLGRPEPSSVAKFAEMRARSSVGAHPDQPDHAAANPPPPPVRPARRRTGLALAGLGVLVLAGLSAAGVLALPPNPSAGTGDAAGPAGAARAWLTANTTGTVLSDPEFTAGWDPARVSTAASCTPQQCRPEWLVATPALRARLPGDRPLAAALGASSPVAVFGTGEDRVEIRHPGPPSPEQAATERGARATVGHTLTGLPRIATTAPVRGLLDTGRVDPRVLAMIATLAQRDTVRVLELPAVPGEDSAGQPRRQMLLGIPADGPAALTNFFAAQTGPYQPAGLTNTPTGLLVAYPPLAPPNLLDAFDGP